MELGMPFQKGRGGPGGWWIVDEPELHLSGDVLVPDLAGWRKDRMPAYPDGPHVALAPDWVCEIVSPSTRKFDLLTKRPVYAREGVRHLWHIDPVEKWFEAFELREGHWTLIAALGDDAQVSVPPFDAIAFGLSEIWR